MRPTGWWKRRRRGGSRWHPATPTATCRSTGRSRRSSTRGSSALCRASTCTSRRTRFPVGDAKGLSVLRLFADDADVDWVTGWCDEDPWSDEDQNMGGYVKFANGTDAYVHTKPSPKDGIEVVCEKGVYHTSWFGGHLWTSTRRGELIEVEDFFDEFGGTDYGWTTPSGRRQRGGIQSIVEAIDNGTEPRCSGDNMRKVLEIAIGFRESHRNGFSADPLPHRRQEPQDRPQAGALAQQEGSLRGGSVCGDDRSGVCQADRRGGVGLGALSTLYITNRASRGRAFPPCTDGSAHHFSERRRTAPYTPSSKPKRSQTTRRSSRARLGSASAR